MGNNIQINFNGFSTRVFIENEKVSATDISVSAQENIIKFDGAYGGEMNLNGNNYFRMGNSSFYELPEISCSIGTEITPEQIENLFFNWLEDRGASRSVLISTGNDRNETFNFQNCYFKSLRLSTSQNSLVTANYDFYVLERELFNEPLINDVRRKQSEPVFDISKKSKIPIGFWETEIKGFGEDKQVLDWNLNFSQEVVPKYYCGRETDEDVLEPPLPDLFIGYPKMELSVSFLIDKEKFDKNIFAKFSDNRKINYPNKESKTSDSENQLSLWIRGKEICRFLYGKVNSYSPSLSSSGGIVFNVSYTIHQICLAY